jgi:hypothetical protein
MLRAFSLFALFAIACGPSRGAGPAPGEAPAPETVVPPTPVHGGRVVDLGEGRFVELVRRAPNHVDVLGLDGSASIEIGGRAYPLFPDRFGAHGALPSPLDEEVQVTLLTVEETTYGIHRVALPLALRAPRHEGTVLAVGSRLVEVRLRADGEVRLFILEGEPPSEDEEVLVVAPAAGDDRHPVRLERADEGPLVGRIEARLKAGPVEVVFSGPADGAQGVAYASTIVPDPLAGSPTMPPGGFQLELPTLGSGAGLGGVIEGEEE